MRVYEFGEAMRYTCLKDHVTVKRGDKVIINCRVEDLPWRPSENRHPRFAWADEQIEAVHMEGIFHPGVLSPWYMITLELPKGETK